MTSARARWLFRLHLTAFVVAACASVLAVAGRRWAWPVASIACLLSGVGAMTSGRTFLLTESSRAMLRDRVEDPRVRGAAERAAANWAGLVLVVSGVVLAGLVWL